MTFYSNNKKIKAGFSMFSLTSDTLDRDMHGEWFVDYSLYKEIDFWWDWFDQTDDELELDEWLWIWEDDDVVEFEIDELEGLVFEDIFYHE